MNQISVDELSITCLMQCMKDYKNDNLIQKVTAEKIAKRTGKRVDAGSRLSYVVIKEKTGIFYNQGESPEYVRDNPSVKIDYLYYLQKQILNPIKMLLVFQPKINVEFQNIVKDTVFKVQRKQSGMKSLISWGFSITNR